MKVFSFDVETNGLWGKAFMLAAVVTNESGEVASFVGRCPIEGQIDDFVQDNVLPTIENVEINFSTYEGMLEAFYSFYISHKDDARVIAHIAFPVETKVLRDMIELNLSDRMWNGPLPLIDVSATLEAKGFNPTSVDNYVKEKELQIPFAGETHHPLYDSWVAEVAYRHLLAN